MPLVLYKTGKIQTQSRKQKSPLLQLSGDPSCPQSGVFPSSLAWYPAYYSISWCIHWTNILWIVSHVGKFFFYPRRSDRTEILSKRTLVQSLATPLSSCKALGKLPNSSLLSSHLKRGSKEHLPHVFVMRVEPWGPAHVKRTSKFWHYNKSELIPHHIWLHGIPSDRSSIAMEWVPYFLGHPGYFCVSLFSCATKMKLCGYNFARVSGYLHGSGREELWPTSKGCSGFAPWSFLRLVFTSLPLWVFLHTGLRGSVRAPWCHPGPSTWVNPVTSLGQENIRAFKPSGNWWADFLNVMSPYGIGTCYNKDEPWRYKGKWNKQVMKRPVLCESNIWET